MEDNITIITAKWAIITHQMVTQTIDTPQGQMQVQQPVQIPIVFRNADEVKRYIDEKYKGEETQIVLQKIQYDLEQEQNKKHVNKRESIISFLMILPKFLKIYLP